MTQAPRIPPVAALRAFEATVRLGGLARAATELNVSTSAVSHQIRGMEQSLGVRLLERNTGVGGIRVTPSGTRLLTAATGALDLLESACADIGATQRRLTVSANAPFSAMWLARRLAEFSALHPDTPLHAVVHENEPDYARDGIDLAIVYVTNRSLRSGDTVLVHETLFPVCSPALYPFASTNVCRCRLLQEEEQNTPELDWRTWASGFQLPHDFETKIVRYSSFSQVIGAALGGAGLALGRSPLIDDELAAGRLVRLRPHLSRPASWRFVLRRGPSRLHKMLDTLIGFLRAEAGASTEPSIPETAANRA